jgi:hypothetical protein
MARETTWVGPRKGIDTNGKPPRNNTKYENEQEQKETLKVGHLDACPHNKK